MVRIEFVFTAKGLRKPKTMIGEGVSVEKVLSNFAKWAEVLYGTNYQILSQKVL